MSMTSCCTSRPNLWDTTGLNEAGSRGNASLRHANFISSSSLAHWNRNKWRRTCIDVTAISKTLGNVLYNKQRHKYVASNSNKSDLGLGRLHGWWQGGSFYLPSWVPETMNRLHVQPQFISLYQGASNWVWNVSLILVFIFQYRPNLLLLTFFNPNSQCLV